MSGDIEQGRRYVWDRYDALWQGMTALYDLSAEPLESRGWGRQVIETTSKRRVNEWLAAKLGIPTETFRVMALDIEGLRAAYRHMAATTPTEVREWARAAKAAREAEHKTAAAARKLERAAASEAKKQAAAADKAARAAARAAKRDADATEKARRANEREIARAATAERQPVETRTSP